VWISIIFLYISKYKQIVCVYALFLLHAILILYWLYLDSSPPSWGDQTDYLLKTLLFYDHFSFQSLDSVKKLLFVSGLRPPLFMYLPSIFYLFNLSIDAAISTNIIFLFILYVSVYGIGKTICNKNIGLLSVLIISLFPMVYGMSRQFLLDFPLTAMFSLSIYLLLLTNKFNNKKYSVLLGLIIGLSMLVKWSFPIFFLYPFAIIIIKENFFKKILIAENYKNDSQLKNILLTIFCGFITCSYWYLPNLNSVINVFKLSAPGTDVTPLFGLSGVFNLKSIFFYILGTINYIGSFSFMSIFLVGLLFYKFFDFNDKLILGTITFVLVSFTLLFENKEFRYVLPLSPLFAVFISKTLMVHIMNYRLKVFLLFLVITLGVSQFFLNSFGNNFLKIDYSIPTKLENPIDNLIFFSNNHRYGYQGYEHSWTEPPSKNDWKIIEILNSINHSFDYEKRIPKIFIIPFLEKFQIGHFKLYAKLNEINISLTHRNRKYEDFMNQMFDYDYIISKTGKICSYHGSNKNINDINQFFNNNYAENFQIVSSFILPDSSTATLFKNKLH